MDNNEELQDLEFDLEDILNEFHVDPDPLDTPEDPKSGAPGAGNQEPAPAAAPETTPAPGMPAVFSHDAIQSLEDTGPMAPISSAADLHAPSEVQEAPEAGLDIPDDVQTPDAPEAVALPEDAPADLEDLPLDVSPDASDAAPSGEEAENETLRFAPKPDSGDAEAYKPPIPGPIPFSTPRSRLRELKKKLVAGPEKRYYILSEAGLGKLQAAILINVLVVLLCAGVTTLFVLDIVPDNRLRLVIFSQVLAMLVSALMGCQLMLDAIIDLFKGRFTVNTLLTITFGVCIADAVFCLEELRVPCCAAFCLSMTMALWARYERHTTEMAQMDTMRKAVRLHGIVKKANYFEGKTGLIRTEGEVEDFMDTYDKPSGPEKLQNTYAFLSLLLCTAIAVFAGLQHGTGMGVQILSASLLVAVPSSFFVSISRPAAILEQRLHMVGTVLCGWQGVRGLRGTAIFPLDDTDLFPQGCTKLNGVKFYGERNPDEVVSYTTSLIYQAGGGLMPVFQQLLASRDGVIHSVESFRNYGGGGIGGIVCGEPVLMGDMAFLQDMGVEIPEGTMVNQAVYAAIDGQLCAVYAISYAKMRSAAAGLVTLSGFRRLSPIMVGSDFMLTEEFIQAKFGVKTSRIAFPDPDTRAVLRSAAPDPEAPVLALATREELVSTAYAVTGARALSTSTKLGVAIHLTGGILGMLVMLVLAVLGSTELLTPTNVLLYQLIWMVPGLLVTEWARTV